jgi:7-cyano-7-deazaguanine synthase
MQGKIKSSGRSRHAVVLLSGGMDSAVTLALARAQGFVCHALTVNYGQRHQAELDAARRVAKALGAVEHRVVPLDLRWIGGSALTTNMPVPKRHRATAAIPITYVPARNTIMLSLALGWAEVLGAHDIFIGVNAVDYSGYPDCRPKFIAAFERTARLATRVGIQGTKFAIHVPLIRMSKAQIVRAGMKLGVDFRTTVSCYDADKKGRACGQCDACRLRRQGFKAAHVADMTLYRTTKD